jgi:hypothetical protein
MKKYRAKFNPERKGVYAISLVDEPAMEGDFVQFKKQEKEIKFAQIDESKRRVMGLILEPNKEVLRFNQEDESYYTVYFEAEDIEDVAYNFQRQGNQNNSTIQHNGKAIEGVSFVETWIVENPKVDKSTNFGLEYPKGSWIGVMQLENEEVWNTYVKTGQVKGFSIDALMEFEEINLNKLNMDVKNEGTLLEFLKELPNKIALAIKPKEAEEKVELAKEVKEEAKVELYHEGEEHDKDKKVKMEDEDEDKEKVKMSHDEEMAAQVMETLNGLVAQITEMLTPMQDEAVALSKKVEALELTVTKQKEELVEFGKEPATTSIKKVPAQLEYSKMSNLEKFNYNKNK